MKAKFGDKVIINNEAPYFHGEQGIAAYIGTEGISVYLTSLDFDDPVPLNENEYDLYPEQ